MIDSQFKGTALGVGSARILGRIHSHSIEILDKVIFNKFKKKIIILI